MLITLDQKFLVGLLRGYFNLMLVVVYYLVQWCVVGCNRRQMSCNRTLNVIQHKTYFYVFILGPNVFRITWKNNASCDIIWNIWLWKPCSRGHSCYCVTFSCQAYSRLYSSGESDVNQTSHTSEGDECFLKVILWSPKQNEGGVTLTSPILLDDHIHEQFRVHEPSLNKIGIVAGQFSDNELSRRLDPFRRAVTKSTQ